MSGSNRSRRNRILFSMTLLITLATFLLAGFGNALATRLALDPPLFLPLIFHDASSPVVGTSTITATVTRTPTANTTPMRTSTPTQTLVSTPTAIVGPGKVLIVDFAFQPAEITVHVGETVEWENASTLVTHTTTSNTGIWDSGLIAPNQKFSFTFTSVGNYPYHCSVHLDMTGIIHVVPNP